MKRGLGKEFYLLSLMVLGMSLFAGWSFAATTISFSPENKEVAQYGNFSVDIMVNNVSEFVGYQFGLKYDPSILAVQSIKQGAGVGSFLSTAAAGSYGFSSGANNVNGTVRFLMEVVLGQNSVSGSGLLARVDFKALNPGESDIYIPATAYPGIMETILLGAGPVNDPDNPVRIPFTIANNAHVSVTPEPVSCLLFVLGGGALVVAKKKR